MSTVVDFLVNTASESQITTHLLYCGSNFFPALSERVEIPDYAKKIISNATRFEAWSNCTLIGLVAAYCNDHEKGIAYITSVSVLKERTGKGIATRLIDQCIAHAKEVGMQQIGLEVAGANATAIRLYEKRGFVAGKLGDQIVPMTLNLKGE